MKKTVQVIMLPMNKALFPNITKNPYTSNLFFNDIGLVKGIGFSYNHLYFTSNEEIKEGDWFIWKSQMFGNIELYQMLEDKGYGMKTTQDDLVVNHSGILGKVIATTDKSLNLPLIPQWFVESYVKNNGLIDEVSITLNNKEVVITPILEDKKQSLEEAATEFADRMTTKIGHWKPAWLNFRNSFIEGTKWHENNK